MSYYLPEPTNRLVVQRESVCQNLGLLLDKYVPQDVIGNSEKKGVWLKTLTRASGSHIDAELAKQAYKRWLSLTAAMQATHFSAALDWRMIVGLGGETVIETDLTLHHLYGIPSIPGSALKGLARAYVTGEVQPSKNEDNDSAEVKRVFGSQKQAGTVLFFDAWPLDGQVSFAVDIMNSHYPKYYGEGKLPTNTQNPNPVTFLTIEKAHFVFAVAPRRPKDQDDVQLVKAWLSAAIQRYGVGGKTNAGYGFFQQPTDITVSAFPLQTGTGSMRENGPQLAPVDPEMQQAEDAKRRLATLKDEDVAGQINVYHQQWQRLTSAEARTLLAQAIIEKVLKAGREKASTEKGWYKDLQAFLAKDNAS
ncbi:MAG: type III-B CRISPR module RAMP protein Cmr6 [Ktedonobacteraceae bacterium]